MDTVVGIAFWVAFAVAARMVVEALAPEGGPKLPRPALAAIALWLVVAVPSLLQGVFPSLLGALDRDADKVADGQLWRLVTSPVVQDGGFAGTVFNLLAFAAIATVAVAYWGGARTWAVFWFGAITANVAVLSIEPRGGGNSMAVFVVVGALTSAILVDAKRRGPALKFASLVLLAMSLLLITLNYHILACGIGLAIGVLPVLRARPIAPAPMQVSRVERRSPSDL